MLFGLPSYQFPYSVMNRCLYLIGHESKFLHHMYVEIYSGSLHPSRLYVFSHHWGWSCSHFMFCIGKQIKSRYQNILNVDCTMNVHFKVRNINLDVTPSLVYILKPYGAEFQFESQSLLPNSPPIYHGFRHWNKLSKIEMRWSHASCCHYCNVDYVLIHNVTCYIHSFSSRIHVNIIQVPNITCTVVATSAILWSLECTYLGMVKSCVHFQMRCVS
jgi:hypothetical protein